MKFQRSIVSLLGALLTVSSPAQVPDFSVTAGDKTFRLSQARGQFVALHFLLKTECPYCLRHVSQTATRAAELAGVQHIFLKPDSAEEIAELAKKMKDLGDSAPPIYRDEDAKLAEALKIPGGYEFHGQKVHYPALVLIGPEGNEVFRYVGKDNTDRLSFDKLAEQVKKLSADTAVKQFNLGDGGLGVQGYDPVAYIEQGTAAAGKPELTSWYRGVSYRFASEQSRRKFAEQPEKFVPAYGGWCATAMAEGRKVEIDPKNFKVTNGRLFLFYKGWLGDALKDWNKDETKLMQQADDAWKKIAK